MRSTSFAAYVPRDRQVITGGVVIVVDAARGLYRVQWQKLGRSYDVDLPMKTCPCRDHARGRFCLHLVAAHRAAELVHGRTWRPWHEYKKQSITQAQ